MRFIDSGGVIGNLYESRGLRRPILLLGSSEGGIPWQHHEDPIHQLVAHGFMVLALPYFGYDNLSPDLVGIPLERLAAAIEWLKSESGSSCVGLVGGSKGAEAALLIAANHKDVCAVVAIAPSAYVFQGIRYSDSGFEPRSSWSVGGEDIPFAPFIDNENRRQANANRSEMRFIEVYRDAVRDPNVRASARIPVENISGPVLLLSGRVDVLWPSVEMGQTIMQSLENHPYPVQHLTFDTGHNVADLDAAWDALLTFLNRNFPDP